MKTIKIETVILLIFFACTAIWAISKCNARRAGVARDIRELIGEEEKEEAPAGKKDTVFVPQPAPAPAPAASKPAVPAQKPVLRNEPPPPAKSPEKPAEETNKYPVLYVTIDGLKVRKSPGLKGEVVAQLELYEPVSFLHKKSEKQEEISLGYEKVTDYWVKIRTKTGVEGWVFGAGVHYYKMKRKGVIE